MLVGHATSQQPALRDGGVVERGALALRQFGCVIICPQMQEEELRLLVQHVGVQRHYLDAVRPQRQDDWGDLVAGQNEVQSSGCLLKILENAVPWSFLFGGTDTGGRGVLSTSLI